MVVTDWQFWLTAGHQDKRHSPWLYRQAGWAWCLKFCIIRPKEVCCVWSAMVAESTSDGKVIASEHVGRRAGCATSVNLLLRHCIDLGAIRHDRKGSVFLLLILKAGWYTYLPSILASYQNCSFINTQ